LLLTATFETVRLLVPEFLSVREMVLFVSKATLPKFTDDGLKASCPAADATGAAHSVKPHRRSVPNDGRRCRLRRQKR